MEVHLFTLNGEDYTYASYVYMHNLRSDKACTIYL